MSAQSKVQLSAAAYLAQESTASEKSEFLNGEVFAMAGASRAHNQITSNLVLTIGSQLLEKPYSVYSSDMKVHTRSETISKYSYPDGVATCGEEQFEDENKTVLLNPLLIIEVLSDSTEAYDRGLLITIQPKPSKGDFTVLPAVLTSRRDRFPSMVLLN